MQTNNTATPTVESPSFQGSDIGCFAENPMSVLDSCVFPQLAGATAGSEQLFGLLLVTLILGLTWYSTGSIGATAGILILLGGAMMPMLPGSYRSLAWSVLVVGLAAAFLALAQRYVLDPTTKRGGL